MARVTGIGGIFFKSRGKSTASLTRWYQKNLGLALEGWGGAILRWPDDPACDDGVTVWHVADRTSKWFSPSRSSFMVNYRVDDMAGILAKLKKARVKVVKGPDEDDNGIFAWILDPDGNKVELWEPKTKKKAKGRAKKSHS
jgi:predicted enzyme related to lactoylglutathione lyase